MGRVLGFVVFPREVLISLFRHNIFCFSGARGCSLLVTLFVEFFGFLLDAGEHALEGLVNLRGLFSAALLNTQLEDVSGSPEHAEGGVATLVGGIHRADGIISFLYATLLTQVEYLFNSHMISMESKYNKRDFTLSFDLDGIEI